VIGAIGIASALRPDADLYIFGEFPDYDVIAEKIRKYDIFKNVYVADDRRSLGSGRAASIRITFFAKKTVSSFLPENVSYKNCYVSSRSTLKSALMSVLRKRNTGMTRILVEDGMATYSEQASLFHVSGLRRRIEKFLGWDLDDPKKIRMMAYLPKLVKVPDFLPGCEVEQMPRLEATPENRDMLMDIFSIEDEQKIAERFIIFDTKRRGGQLDHLTGEEMTVMDECYDRVFQQAKEQVICKPHPKSVQKTGCAVAQYPYQGIPMEALYFNMEDLDERVLISHVSTAVFTPKIFLDREPVVICLHRILKDNAQSADFEPIFEKFKGMYRDRSRVYAPESPEEIDGIIRNLLA